MVSQTWDGAYPISGGGIHGFEACGIAKARLLKEMSEKYCLTTKEARELAESFSFPEYFKTKKDLIEGIDQVNARNESAGAAVWELLKCDYFVTDCEVQKHI